MSQSPAAYLRALDQTATPGKLQLGETMEFGPDTMVWIEYEKPIVGEFTLPQDARAFVALRTLLPLLADVVEAAQKLRELTWYVDGSMTVEQQQAFDVAWQAFERVQDAFTAAVAEREGRG